MNEITEKDGVFYSFIDSGINTDNTLSSQATALVLDEILAKIQRLHSVNMNIVAILVTERLFNGICGNKMVLIGDTIMPKKSAMKKLYGISLKAKEPTTMPHEKQFSIEVV